MPAVSGCHMLRYLPMKLEKPGGQRQAFAPCQPSAAPRLLVSTHKTGFACFSLKAKPS